MCCNRCWLRLASCCKMAPPSLSCGCSCSKPSGKLLNWSLQLVHWAFWQSHTPTCKLRLQQCVQACMQADLDPSAHASCLIAEA